jgi:hypothetical protein
MMGVNISRHLSDSDISTGPNYWGQVTLMYGHSLVP